MSNIWTSEDKVPIEQKKVTVPATHGLNYSPGQKIEFQIPGGLGFIQPKESYLKFDVKIKLPTWTEPFHSPTRLQLDQFLGGQILIKDLRVYSGGAGRILLEEFQNYNVLAAVKYDYESNDNFKAKRALTEGAVCYDPTTRSTTGEAQDSLQNLGTNPYWATPGTANNGATDQAVGSAGGTTFTDSDFETVKCLLPLHTGIFQNDKIFPVGMTDGLVVEMILEDANKCIKCLDTTNLHRKLWGNPVFLSASSAAAPNSAPLYPKASSASRFSQFTVRRDNLMGVNASVGISNFPFVVGEEIGFVNASTGVDNPPHADYDENLRIDAIVYQGGTTNAIRVVLDGVYKPTNLFTKNDVMYSKSIANASTSFAPTYEITNCEFIAQQVTMPAGYTSKLSSMMSEGGAMNYDFLSWTNYKISQVSSEVVATLRIPLNQSRAKSLLCIPTDSSVHTNAEFITGAGCYVEDYSRNASAAAYAWLGNHSNRAGLVGIADNITQYQLFYGGKLNPNRKVVCSKTSSKVSVDQQPLIELEKALVMGHMTPHSLLPFRKNFIIGRALSLHDGVYDARGKDFQLQVEYLGTAPGFNKLWNCWCGHMRRIVIAGESINMEM